VANRQTVRTEGQLRGARLLNTLGDELREARLASGLTQRAVASSMGSTRRHVSHVERGRAAHVQVQYLAWHAAAVGLRLHARMYPAGAPLRDAGQLALLDRFRARIAADWRMQLEAPIPGDRDRRAWDLLLRTEGVSVGVEAITRLRDVQAQLRSAQVKRQDAAVKRLVILVAATHANRRALAGAEPLLHAALPVGTRAAMAALALGRDPGGDALVLL
jgi:transcriptional regulator with XRE-family HTH domain